MRGRVAIEPREDRGGCGVGYDGDLEAYFQQLSHVRLNTEVARHARQDHPVDSGLAKLECQIVLFRPEDLVGAGNDSLPVLDRKSVV